MDNLSAMFDICESSPAYIHIPQDSQTFASLRDALLDAAPDDILELETLVNAHASAATLEGFINGWVWAQATAQECLSLREQPKGLYIKMNPELLSASVEAMRDLQARYEADAAALATIEGVGVKLAQERLESAQMAQGLFNFFSAL